MAAARVSRLRGEGQNPGHLGCNKTQDPVVMSLVWLGKFPEIFFTSQESELYCLQQSSEFSDYWSKNNILKATIIIAMYKTYPLFFPQTLQSVIRYPLCAEQLEIWGF